MAPIKSLHLLGQQREPAGAAVRNDQETLRKLDHTLGLIRQLPDAVSKCGESGLGRIAPALYSSARGDWGGMRRKSIIALVLSAFAFALNARAEEGWTRLKTGMTRVETVNALGRPLMRSHGRGFEVWIYDGGAEVVCYRGALVAWTAPATRNSTAGRAESAAPAAESVAPEGTSTTRNKVHKVYDKFPAFRSEITL